MSYSFNHADQPSVLLFSLFSILMFLLVLFTFYKSKVSRKVALGFTLYLFFFSLVVYFNLPEKYFIPTAPIMFLSVIVGSAYIAFSKIGIQISNSFSLKFLIGLQLFRLPLELILHHWVDIKTIPETMTWTGQNWDIISGALAFVALPFLNKNHKLAWFVQITGFFLLLNVLRVVVFSLPLPFAWPLQNPLLLIAYLPYALIGPLFVGLALTFHLVTFRKLINS